MPLNWTISHPHRLVTVVAEGDVTREEIEQYLDGVVTSGALAYRKIFDATNGGIVTDSNDMMILGARIRAYPAFGRLGPLAIVATNDRSRWQARLFLQLAEVDRPIKIFRSAGAARKWLDAQPEGEPPAET
jgi:hypothetical protein